MKHVLVCLFVLFSISSIFSIPLEVHQKRFEALEGLKEEYYKRAGEIAFQGSILEASRRLVCKMIGGKDGLRNSVEFHIGSGNIEGARDVLKVLFDLCEFFCGKEGLFEATLGGMEIHIFLGLHPASKRRSHLSGKLKVLLWQTVYWTIGLHNELRDFAVESLGLKYWG
jgi:hypothetical protein